VAIARALINEPDLILCDEPTGNLDKESQERVMGLLRKLNEEKKKTIVLVTHNLELAKRAKRMIFIKNGEIVDKLF
jgi:putative ABC transport system ATP-binding protein